MNTPLNVIVGDSLLTTGQRSAKLELREGAWTDSYQQALNLYKHLGGDDYAKLERNSSDASIYRVIRRKTRSCSKS